MLKVVSVLFWPPSALCVQWGILIYINRQVVWDSVNHRFVFLLFLKFLVLMRIKTIVDRAEREPVAGYYLAIQISRDHCCCCCCCCQPRWEAKHQHLAHEIRELEGTKATVLAQFANMSILEPCVCPTQAVLSPPLHHSKVWMHEAIERKGEQEAEHEALCMLQPPQ